MECTTENYYGSVAVQSEQNECPSERVVKTCSPSSNDFDTTLTLNNLGSHISENAKDKDTASNLFSPSSSLSDEMDVEDTEGFDNVEKVVERTKVHSVKELVQQEQNNNLNDKSAEANDIVNQIPVSDKPSKSKLRGLMNADYRKEIPLIFRKRMLKSYTEIIPDDEDPYYFCRVCKTRSVSRTAYYEHLTSHHQMKLSPIEHWRVNDPEIIPVEFDQSNCCIDCQKVFPIGVYRQHLKRVHHISFINWSKADRELRTAAIFNPKDFVLNFAKIDVNLDAESHECFHCYKRFKKLRSMVKHCFADHNIIVELGTGNNKVSSKDKENIPQVTGSTKELPQSEQKRKRNPRPISDRVLTAISTNPPATDTRQIELSINTTVTSPKIFPEAKSKPREHFLLNLTDWGNTYCYKCQKTVSSRRYLLIHIYKMHDDCAVGCADCNVELADFDVALAHFSTSHKVRELPTSQSPAEQENEATQEDNDNAALEDSISDVNNHKEGDGDPSLSTFMDKLMEDSEPRCHICDLEFESRYSALMHFLEIHKQISPEDNNESESQSVAEAGKEESILTYNCDKCGQCFDTDDLLSAHKRSLHSQRPRKRRVKKGGGTIFYRRYTRKSKRCKICLKVFFDKTEFTKHAMVHANKVTPESTVSHWPCTTCNQVFTQESKLQVHFTEMHQEPSLSFPCQICNRTYLSIHELRIHEKVSHEATEFKCSLCSRYFPSKRSLMIHHIHCVKKQLPRSASTNVSQPLTTSVFPCDICDEKFLNRRALNKHHREIHGPSSKQLSIRNSATNRRTGRTTIPLHQCHSCERRFMSTHGLGIHQTKAHPSTTTPSYQCGSCRRRFVSTLALKAHYTKAHGSDSTSFHQCLICERTFSSTRGLRLHHAKAHETRKPPKRLFIRASTSNGESTATPQCRTCKKRFLSDRALKLHYTMKHERSKTEISCTLCSRVCLGISGLKIHWKKLHGSQLKLSVTSEKNITKVKRKNHLPPKDQMKELICTTVLCCLLCQKDFADQKSLQNHCASVHAREKSQGIRAIKYPIKCTECDKAFSSCRACALHARYVHKTLKIRYIQLRKCDFEDDTTYTTSKKMQLLTENANQNEEQQPQLVASQEEIDDLMVGERKRKPSITNQETSKKRKKLISNTVDNVEGEKADGILNYVCNVCHHVISDRILFRQHREKTHRIKPLWDANEKYCNVCQCEFNTKERYKIHSEDVHNLFPN